MRALVYSVALVAMVEPVPAVADPELARSMRELLLRH